MNTVNEQEKKRLTNQTISIKKKLEEHFELKVVQDFLSKDEKDELGDSYNYFIIEEDGFDAPMSENGKYSVSQNVYVTFYSEGRESLTGDQLDVLTLLHSSSFKFNGTEVNHLKLDNQDRFIDQVIFSFKRIIRSGC
ncbi:hypothetical protein P7H43_06170 [Enterococcus asini]|uniref:DUF806 family protein n=1 Tax=Enterococcus asini TaxID=57732 RepID=A0AAW8TUV9_9ENTE|nr:hypothetical protein [Enterococcus asini]MDT2810063.1 hypothetical protein [Enterococcus asini]